MRIGQTVTRAYQRYKYVGKRRHISRDGRALELIVLTSHCVDCGAPFEFATTRWALKNGLNRRCSLHKAPGVRVGSKRRRALIAPPLAPTHLPTPPALPAPSERILVALLD